MRCKSCGRTGVPDGSAFCNWCGKKLVKTRAKKAEIKVPDPVQLPSGMWRIYLRKESRNVMAESQEQCRAKAIAIRAGYLEQSKTRSITLRKAIDKYIDSKTNVLSPATIRGYRNIQNTRFKAYMDTDITKMTDRRWQQAVNEECIGLKPKTVKNAWMFISSVLVYSGMPKPQVTLPMCVPKATPFLDPKEIYKFVDTIEGTDIEIVCLLGLSSLRASEAHALRWKDVDLENRVIHVRRSVVKDENGVYVEKDTNKNLSSTRTVPIMMNALYRALMEAEDKEGLVVKMSMPMVRKRLKKACAAAEVTPVTFHGLRHTFASLGAHLRMPEAVVMQIGGWSNDKIMKRIYTHVLETDITRYRNDMSNYYNGTEEAATESAEEGSEKPLIDKRMLEQIA